MNIIAKTYSHKIFRIFAQFINVLHKSVSFYLIFLFAQLYGRQIMFPPDLYFQNTWKTRNLELLMNLNGVWKNEKGEIYRVPFIEDEKDEMVVKKDFFFKELPKDTLYLYLEGVSWQSEIYLNGKLLTIFSNPFQDNSVAIPPFLFQQQWNSIEIQIKRQLDYSDQWLVVPYIGIYGSVFLLQKSSILHRFVPLNYALKDSVLIYFPFSKDFVYRIPKEKFSKDLDELKSIDISHLYIPYFLNNELREVLNEKQFTLQPEISSNNKLAVYQTFMSVNVFPYWISREEKPTEHFLKYYSKNTELIAAVPELSKPIVISLYFVSLMLLLWFRWLNAETYQRFWVLFPNSKVFVNYATDIQFISSLSLFVSFFLRMFLKVLILTFFLVELNLSENLDYLNFWHKNSLIFLFSREYANSLFTLFFYVLLVMFGFNVAKILLWQVVGTTYRIRDFRNKSISIEVWSEMPFVFWVFTMLMGLLLVGTKIWLYGFVIFVPIFAVRKYFYLFVSYNSIFKIPYSVIFFYICSLEILPWLLLI